MELVSPTSKKLKKSAPKKFHMFLEMNLSSSKIKKCLIFPEMELSSLIFLLISASNFLSPKNKKNTLKKLLIFREMELSSPKLKKLLICQDGTRKARKTKNLL